MKFSPLNNHPNISVSRFKSVSPSMALDSRGYPHIAWMDLKNGHNKVKYATWDGIQWMDPYTVDESETEIQSSANAIELDLDENVNIVYSKKTVNGSALIRSVLDGNKVIIDSLNVSYDADWIGIFKHTRDINFSSSSGSLSMSTSSESSSSSIDSSSQSSSFSVTSSISSLSSVSSQEYSSLSSSIDSSSSSSIDSSSSSSKSSSSSINDDFMFVVTVDTIGTLRVYGIDNEWRELSSVSTDIDKNFFSAGIASRYLGVSYLADNAIKYNFLDLDTFEWVSNSLMSHAASYGEIVTMGANYYGEEEECVLSVGWSERDDNYSYLMYSAIRSGGTIENYTLETEQTNQVSSPYISNGYREIAIAKEARVLMAMGARSKSFALTNNGWESSICDICGASEGIVSKGVRLSYDGRWKIAFSNNYSDIYYFEDVPSVDIQEIYPQIMVYNEHRMYKAVFSSGSMYGEGIPNTYENRTAQILRESISPVIVSANDNEGAFYNSSSSSSSESFSVQEYDIQLNGFGGDFAEINGNNYTMTYFSDFSGDGWVTEINGPKVWKILIQNAGTEGSPGTWFIRVVTNISEFCTLFLSANDTGYLNFFIPYVGGYTRISCTDSACEDANTCASSISATAIITEI